MKWSELRISDDQEVLVITEKGYGKRTLASEYPTKGRGGKGIKTANIAEKNGQLAGLATVNGDEDIMVITDTGLLFVQMLLVSHKQVVPH